MLYSVKKKAIGEAEEITSYPFETLFQLMVGEYGISPVDYWKMSPSELSLIFDAKRPKQVGKLHEDDFNMLAEKREKLEAEGVNIL